MGSGLLLSQVLEALKHLQMHLHEHGLGECVLPWLWEVSTLRPRLGETINKDSK